MLVSAADAVTSPQPALAAPSAPAQRATVLERPDEASALVTARMNHGPVKITGLTTETSEFFAQPDGTVEATVHAAPVRVRSGNQWVPVDLKLRANADGTVSSVAHPEGLTISGARTGTAGALATVGHGAEQISMGWTGKLPEPVLEGARATYRDVLPGIDLAVEATRTGFEQFVVVKTREAATRVGELSLPLTGASVSSYTRDASGALVLKNKKGRTLATSPTPMMWDAQVGADGVTPKRQTVVTSAATRRTAKSASAGRNASAPGVDVRLTPDRAWINDPATQFPVTIDPQVAVGTVFDTYVTDGDTGDRGGVNNLQIGLLSGAGGKRTRSFVSWDTTALRGKQITAATASFYNYYSTTCAANSWEIWSTNAFNDATRWANQPAWLTKEASATGTRGFDSSCGDAYVAISATSFFQRAATANQTRGYMGIRATSETATSAFKQFRSRNAAESNQVPKATVTYNSYPVIGTRSTVPATACATGTARPFIASKTPQLKAKLTDPEGTAMTASFEWSTTAGAGVTTATTAKAASGSTFSTTIPANALAENGSYRWRVRGYDSTGYSPWSAYCEFTVDTTAPALPAVASTDYPAGQWSGGAGSPGKFTLSASGATDVASYQYGLDVNPPDQTVNAASLGAAATVTITPATAGAHTLYVRSRDRAGNLSPVKTYSFSAGGAAITAPKDGDLSAGFVAIEGSGNSTSTGVTYQWRRGDLDTWTTIPTGDVTTAAGQQAVTWPLSVPAGGSAPKLNWNLAQTVNAAEAGPDPLDGPVQLRGLFTGGAGATSNPVKLTLDRNRAWAATEDVGVGSVNLITGNLATEERDSATGASLGRTANSRLAREVDPMFGPGWSSSVSVTGDDSGYTTLSVTGSLVQIALDDGATMGFTKKTATTFTPQVGLENLKLAYTATGDTYTLTDEAGLAVTFGRPGTQPAGQYVPTSAAAKGTTDKISYSWETVTVAGAAITRPTLAINPPPAGITCTAASLVKGCRATKFSYATASTASGTAPNQWGDYAGRIKELTFTAWDPDASPAQMKTVVLKRYAYDNTGRLRSAWDPRLDRTESGVVRHLETTYAYDADGLVSEVRPAGQEPWNLIYSVIPGDSGKGRLVQVARGIGTAIARTTVVYAVPLTGAGAPYDLSAAQTARWAQPEAPVLATALFPATQVPDGNQATGALPSSYERASISYLDANGRTVNGAEPGGYISSQSYDKWGNQIRSLDAANRQQALEDSTTDTADQEAGLAGSLSELNVFSGDGSRLTSAFEPEREVSLPDGSSVRGRPYTEYSYDEGAPATDEPFNVVTTETRMVRVWGSDGATYDADKRTTKTTYDWTLLEPLTETVDPGGLNLVTRYQYDPVSKRKISETAPGGSAAGDTPSTQRILYYRVGTGSGNAACDNRPEFNDLICRVEPGGQAESGPAVPVKVVTYDMFGQVRKTEESTSAGVQRTTTATYDAANRPQQQSITAAAGLGEAVPVTRTVYDPATGLLTRLQSVDANGAVTAEIVYGYDTLGRARSYKDADGITSTFDYDLLDRPTTTTDGLGTRTYAYDGGTERRGLPTSVADSQAGTYTAAYDANGGVISQQWPNGVVVQAEANEAGDAVGITYTQAGCAADDCTLFSESLTASVHSQVSNRTSSLSQQDFSYDSAGRLAKVQDTVDSNCVTRVFGYDAGTNRTSTTSYDATEDGSCQTGTVAGQVTRGYDKADRLTTAGYEYDALGRTRIVPAVDSPIPGGGQSEVSYYASNLTRKIVQDDRSSVYQLDVTGNRYRSRAETRGAATTTKVNHYSADGDSPSWTDEGNTTTTRTIVGIAGTTGTHSSTAGLTSFITNLHGDVVAGMAGSSQGLAYTSDYTEDGQPRTPGAETHRYGWLGSEQRASDTPNGLTLMGVRLYNPTTSRFLSVDPVRGGNANDYDYCSGDSVNCSDVSGAFSCKWQKKSVSLNWRGWKYDLKRKCWITNAETRFLMMYGGFSAAMYGVFAGFTAPLIATGAGILVPLALAAMGAIIGAIVWFADKIYEDRCGKRKGFYVNARIYKNRGWSRRPHWSAGMGCNK
ncbi:RHS repeat-associated core domain-containing protein [Actinoplanes sp. TFC3]|uniref:RHS repeat-associated core domain-containing protein n=1 Tax=Actinoplanes sp. TFC3 TaxID=1710355 RepID=UPI00082AE519|nr:RHS repeat-associated core domain-containing protein [Actinoplanes sp. TFC3]